LFAKQELLQQGRYPHRYREHLQSSPDTMLQQQSMAADNAERCKWTRVQRDHHQSVHFILCVL